MLNFIKNWFYTPNHPGALPDDRPETEIAKDYRQEEIVTAPVPVIWAKKASYRTFTPRRQGSSGSCVAQGIAKEFEIRLKQNYGDTKMMSAAYPYQKRANPAVSGSTPADRTKMINSGCLFEDLMPSQSLSDSGMMAVYKPKYADDLASVFGIKDIVCPLDIDVIASTIETTGKGVAVWFRFGPGEWFYRKEVGTTGNNLPWGHAVVAVDYTLDDAGNKCLVIEDSASEDGYTQRLVPGSFLNARCFLCRYMMDFKTSEISKPVFTGSISSMQDCLKYEKLFPTNTDSTGLWYGITDKAVKLFCIKYDLKVPADRSITPELSGKLKEIYN